MPYQVINLKWNVVLGYTLQHMCLCYRNDTSLVCTVHYFIILF